MNNCPICLKSDFEQVALYLFDLRGETVCVSPVLCLSCGLVFLYPAPDLRRYYSQQERFTTETKAYQDQADWIGPRAGRVLDVGAYDGRLLNALWARKRGAMTLHGVEPDLSLSGWSYDRYMRLEDVTGKFDLITMAHVLEHVPEPVETLRSAAGLLSDGGQLFIEVPNLERPYIQTVPFWKPQHQTYFTLATLMNALAAAGLFVVRHRLDLPYCGFRVLAKKAFGFVPMHIPDVGGSRNAIAEYARRRLVELRRIETLLGELKGKVAIIGGGEHTQYLLKLGIRLPEFAYIIDSFSERKRLCGLPVRHDMGDADHIVISSYDSQERLAEIVGPRAVRLYEKPIAYDTWGGK